MKGTTVFIVKLESFKSKLIANFYQSMI